MPMNRFVLVVAWHDYEPGTGDETYFLPVATFLCRAGLEASLLEAAEAARDPDRMDGLFEVPGTTLVFAHPQLVNYGMVDPPRVMTLDEWFTEYGRG